MNFTPFNVGVPISTIPVTQFTSGGKMQNVTTANGQVVGVLQGGENGIHYIRPLDASAFTTTTQSQNAGPTQTLITLPITMPGAKPGDPQQHVQIQVVNPVQPQVSQANAGGHQSPKYHFSQAIPLQTFGQGATVLTVAYNPGQDGGIQILDGQNGIAEGMTVVAALQPQDIQLIQASQEPDKSGNKDGGGCSITPVALIKSELASKDGMDENDESSTGCGGGGTSITVPAQYIHNVNNVQEYLQKMQQTSALPLSLQQFLKFNTPNIKTELMTDDGVIEAMTITTDDGQGGHLILNEIPEEMDPTEENAEEGGEKGKKKKKYKKKPPKPKKPKPGQVHIATALDGTTLFCCPECHMAYPEKELLEQHLVGHKIERRFICDICGAGLKRKEHLERHKLGHNPDRPFVCTVCMKGFKRKEHLNLHFVIHSGEKNEICPECGKGFYRKDHLRKHARSHITRRAKEQAERAQQQLQQQGAAGGSTDGGEGSSGIVIKAGGNGGTTTTTAQVTIQVPTTSQEMHIPVQIQVPQHHIQVTSNQKDDHDMSDQVSTVVLPPQMETIVLPQT